MDECVCERERERVRATSDHVQCGVCGVCVRAVFGCPTPCIIDSSRDGSDTVTNRRRKNTYVLIRRPG